jgi:hypothetical protein
VGRRQTLAFRPKNAIRRRGRTLPTDRVARLLLGLARNRPAWFTDIRLVGINGSLGVVGYSGDLPTSVITLGISDGRIRAVFNVRNPDDLRAGKALKYLAALAWSPKAGSR